LDRILLVTTQHLVNVSEAARILSVSTKTIRRSDARLGPQRDGNGYRVYEPDLLVRCLRNGHKPSRRSGTLDTLHLGSCANMRAVRDRSVNLVFTSPPYPRACRAGLRPDDWVEWFLRKAGEIQRTLRRDGSLFLVVKEPVVNGERHTFMHDLVREMRASGWRYCDELIWMMPNPLPRRAAGRLKDSFHRVLHFSLSRNYAFYPDAVRQPARPTNGQNKRYRTSVGGFKIDAANFGYADTALPGNVLTCAHVSQSLLHDSAHPDQLASFFIQLTTEPGDVVLDPFAGSGTTLVAAKRLGRRWVGYEVRRSAYHAAMSRIEHESETESSVRNACVFC
jgi:site-specific DNA-methyltransferase (adenine-specific)